MRNLFLGLLCLISFISLKGQLRVTEVGNLIESVSNNAVCEGFIDGRPYLFSFGGIDSTKEYSGIHSRSFRYDIESGESMYIPQLPDSRGKIASAASRIGNIIYISGGYYVNSNGTEKSSDRMHKYDVTNNVYLADGAAIPVATDDHVQVVWRDSLIYLITGWKDFGNIPDVQMYNPSLDSWLRSDPVPNSNDYKSFGASGFIVEDTIFYYGGAASSNVFPIQNQLRKGVINPDEPTNIAWSVSTPDSDVVGYRMAATTVKNELHWIGGSEQTYNFDGIAYNGSGGVPPSNRDLYTTDRKVWEEERVAQLPMDLRGIAKINDTLQYLAGGMIEGQVVTNKVFKLEWSRRSSNNNLSDRLSNIEMYPNPVHDFLTIKGVTGYGNSEVEVYSADGILMLFSSLKNGKLDMSAIPPGAYQIRISDGESSWTQTLLKANK